MRVRTGKMAVAFLVVLAGWSSLATAATALVGVNANNGYNNFPGESCGWQFTPTVDIKVTKLGYWAGLGDWLYNSATITIYDSAGHAKVVGIIPSGYVTAMKEGVYAYVPVISQNVVLTAGQTYTIASYWTMGSGWNYDVQYTATYSRGSSLITLGQLDLKSSGQAMPADMGNTWNTFLSPNFQFEPPMPTANAGPDSSIYTSQETLAGTASDPSPGPSALTYRWLEGDLELQSSTAVGEDGSANLALASLVPPLAVGTHTLTLEVTDGAYLVCDTMILTVLNTPPEAAPAPAFQTKNSTEAVSVSAEVADFDGDLLSYQWLEGVAQLGSGEITPPAGGQPVSIPGLELAAGTLSPGEHVIQLVVCDGVNVAIAETVTVQIVDTTAPTLAPMPDFNMLWPPNHELWGLRILAGAADNSGVVTLMARVQSNEPEDAAADGSTEVDCYIESVDSAAGTIFVQLRAERSGTGEGRVYTVTIDAADPDGNVSSATVLIRVPHDKKKK